MAVVADPVPFSFEGFTLDPLARTLVDPGGECISLRRSEFELLLAFVEKPGRALSRDCLLEAVAGRHSEAFDRSIDVLVGRLRRKMEQKPKEPRLILTVPGIGYRFAAKPHRVPLRNEVTATLTADAAHPITRPPPRLSIVVLPFTYLSDDREQQYFADGITEDLTTDLSRIADMLVISRNTAFTYRNKPVDTKQIGRELGVRYMLEGSVRRSGKQVRVNAQLIDAESDAHLWAERFDSDMDDLFALQDEITSRIAVAFNLELISTEAARTTEHPDALDYLLRGRAAMSKPPTRENFAEAIGLFERALALDPRSVEAQSLLATVLANRVLDQMSTSAAADIARAEGLAGQALAASPRSPLAHYAKGQVLRAQNRFDEAITEYETVIALDRNRVNTSTHLGQCKFYNGLIEEYIPLVEWAIRLSPRDPQLGVWFGRIGLVHLLQSRINEAILWLEKARNAAPALPYVRSRLASAYALNGEIKRAAAELTEARRLSRDDRYSSIARLKIVEKLGVPKIRALFEATFFAGLRKAGMAEE
jgi:TolB-like protein/Flp pilus assembly protein TadD